jgi:hypothetical protein
MYRFLNKKLSRKLDFSIRNCPAPANVCPLLVPPFPPFSMLYMLTFRVGKSSDMATKNIYGICTRYVMYRVSKKRAQVKFSNSNM